MMKLAVAALSFLFFAAALESKLQDTRRDALHNAADCCFSLIKRKIRCASMEDYFETSSGCPRSGVIFRTKKGRMVCADGQGEGVLDCMMSLKSRK